MYVGFGVSQTSNYRVEWKEEKTPSVIKEWILSGSQNVLFICENSKFEHKVGGYVLKVHEDLEFHVKKNWKNSNT